jgi:hypothetical protein
LFPNVPSLAVAVLLGTNSADMIDVIPDNILELVEA